MIALYNLIAVTKNILKDPIIYLYNFVSTLRF